MGIKYKAMTNLTHALHASIDYETSKRSIMNLMNHSAEHLSVVIELIEKERKELEFITESLDNEISSAEDMSEDLEIRLRNSITEQRNKLETLLAWRLIFVNAWSEVKNKTLIK
jgi:hypothetical protein